MAVRDKSRLDKFKMLLASPSTDLGELASPGRESSRRWFLLQGPQLSSHTHLGHVLPGVDLQERRSDVSSVEAAADFSC